MDSIVSFLQDSIYGTYAKGGPIMHVLLLFSIASLAVIIDRLWVLQRAKTNTKGFLDKIVKAVMKRDINAAVKTCESNPGPTSAILKAGLLKFGKPPEEIEKTLENAAIHELSVLEKWLPVLATVAGVAPLVGFLGTVVGMINSFDVLASQGLNNPALVARGISIALITTAGGLIVAVPTLLFHNYFASRVTVFVKDMETSSTSLLEAFAEVKE